MMKMLNDQWRKANLWQNLTRTRLVGQILRKPGLLNLIMNRSVEDENCRVRQRQKCIKQETKGVGCGKYVAYRLNLCIYKSCCKSPYTNIC